MLLRLAKLAAALVGVLILAVVAASFHPFVRSVYRAFRPATQVDARPPQLPDLDDPAVLVFSKTNGFRHFAAIEAGAAALRGIAARRGWSYFHTENGAVFDTPVLERVRVLVWLCTSGAPLSESQRFAVRRWIEGGGGIVGIHAALDASHVGWEWYQDEILGAGFIGHPLEHQVAALSVERPQHPVVDHLPGRWEWFDEWYSFDRSVRSDSGVEVLVSVDEATYVPRLKLWWVDNDLSMGDHPVIWTKQVAQGRAFLSALGHNGSAYEDPEHLRLLERAIVWAGRMHEVPAEGAAELAPEDASD